MKDLVAAQLKLVPDLVETMKRRYQILQHILLTGPIGRRTLAQQLHTTERILRGEVELLREQDLVLIEPMGMRLTESGIKLMNELVPVMRAVDGMSELEGQLSLLLGIPVVIVVPGDQDQDPLVQRELGYVTAKYMQAHLQDGDIVAVTGGTTMAAVAEMMPQVRLPRVEVIPARGGLGERVETLANTIASAMAAKLGGSHKLLHVPDSLPEEAYQALAKDPAVAETLKKVRSAHMVVHGIGQAITMARRRNLSADVIKLLQEKQAVSESFGYFFNNQGEVVYVMNSLGLRMNDLDESKTLIAVAGGASKAEAVLSFARGCRQDVLITDQACAEGIAVQAIGKPIGGEKYGNKSWD